MLGGVIADLLIKVGADVREGVDGLGDVESKMTQVAGSMRKIGLGMTATLTAPILAFGKMAFTAASDVNEGMSAVRTVYGDAGDAVVRWSSTTADAMGISKAAALQTMAVLSSTSKSAGLTNDEMAKFGEGLIQRAADMASFYNASTPEALTAMQASLRGEFDPLERFGVQLNADMVRAKALEMGLVDANGEMTQQGKVLATNALIMEKSSAVAGDFARTQDGAANMGRRLQANMEDLSATFGTVLLPIGNKLLTWMNNAIKWLKALSPETQKVVVVILALVAAIGPLLVVIGTLVPAISAGVTALAGLGPALALLTGPIGLVILAIGLLAIAYKKNFLGFADAVNYVAGAIADFAKVIYEKVGPVIRIIRLFVEGLRKLGGGDSARVHKILQQLPAPLAKLLILFGRVRQMIVTFIDTWKKLGALAAFRTLPKSIELIGRTFSNLLRSMGLEHFADAVRRVFEDVARVVGDVVSLVDDLIHGRWQRAWDDFLQLVRDLGQLAIDTFLAYLAQWRDVFGKLFQIFEGIDWGALASKGAELMAGLYHAAVAFLTGTVIPWLIGLGGQILAALPSFLTTLLNHGKDLLNGLWDGVKWVWDNVLSPFFSGLLTRVIGAIPAAATLPLKLVSHGKAILGGLWDGVKWIWDTILSPFFNGLLTRIIGAMPAVSTLGLKLLGHGKEILNGLWNGVKDVWNNKVTPFFTDIGKAIELLIPDDIGNTVRAAFEGVFSVFDDLLSLAQSVLDVVKDIGGALGFGGGGSGDTGSAPQTGTGSGPGPGSSVTSTTATMTFDGSQALEDIQKWAEDAKKAFEPLNAYLIFSTGSGAATSSTRMSPPIFEGEGAKILVKTWVDNVVAFFKRLNLASAEQVRALKTNVDIQMADMATKGKTQTEKLRSGVSNEFVGMRNDCVRMASQLNIDAGNEFADLYNYLLGGGSAIMYLMKIDVKDSFKNMRDGSVDVATDLKEKVQAQFSSLSVGVLVIMGVVENNVVSGIEDAKNSGYAASEDFLYLGQNIGVGLAQGVNDTAYLLTSAVTNAVNSAIAAGNQAAQVASPSRRSRWTGRMIATGYALGALDRINDVSRAGARVVSAMFGAPNRVSFGGAGSAAVISSGGDTHNWDVHITVGQGDGEETGRKIAKGLIAEMRSKTPRKKR